jgi:hypothetical protein
MTVSGVPLKFQNIIGKKERSKAVASKLWEYDMNV